MGYQTPNVTNDQITGTALKIAGDGATDINTVLNDIAGSGSTGLASDGAKDVLGDGGATSAGAKLLSSYGVSGSPKITDASGAMIIDDLMQKISTKVQVAAQLLSTANNINKTVSRIMSQG